MEKKEIIEAIQHKVIEKQGVNNFKNKFTLSLNYILSMQPEKFSFELTEEKSAFFTIKKNNYTLFFQQYFELIDGEDDEALLSIYNGESKVPSMAGDTDYILGQISNLIMPPDWSFDTVI